MSDCCKYESELLSQEISDFLRKKILNANRKHANKLISDPIDRCRENFADTLMTSTNIPVSATAGLPWKTHSNNESNSPTNIGEASASPNNGQQIRAIVDPHHINRMTFLPY